MTRLRRCKRGVASNACSSLLPSLNTFPGTLLAVDMSALFIPL